MNNRQRIEDLSRHPIPMGEREVTPEYKKPLDDIRRELAAYRNKLNRAANADGTPRKLSPEEQADFEALLDSLMARLTPANQAALRVFIAKHMSEHFAAKRVEVPSSLRQ